MQLEQINSIDQVIKNAINVMDNSKYQIYEIAESARTEWENLKKELEQVIEETRNVINQVDKLEVDYRRSRIRLTEVSRDFHKFKEEDIRIAYEAATNLQMQLTMARDKENQLKARRDELQKRLRNVNTTIERAESLVIQMNVVLEYLSGDLQQVSKILESAKNRQLLGLKIILAQEDERKRVARDIHDGLAQSMANIVMRTEITERMLAMEQYSGVKEELLDLKLQLRSGLEEVRKIIFNLRPMTLDDLGLVPTVRKFVQDFEDKTKIRSTFELVGRDYRLPSAIEVAVFRLMQESFSNIVKHANASFVSTEVSFQKDLIRITIQDNGVGFQVDALEEQTAGNTAHFGIMGMRERLDLLDGTFEIKSSKGMGTRIIIGIPLGDDNKEE